MMTFSPYRHISSILWKRRPIQLTFFLTRKCNARCPFCFYLSRPGSGAPELSLDEIERASASLGSLLWLAFSGGEPFLRRDLVDVAKVFSRNNRPSIILLPTNGLLPDLIQERTRAILRSCPNSIVTVKLSLDGPKDVHDRLRGVPEAYEKVFETHQGLRGLLRKYPNFELGFNTVMMSANQDRMQETIGLVKRLAPGTAHTVSLVRGSVAEQSLKHVDPGRYRDAAELLAAGLAETGAGRYRFAGSRLKAAQDVVQRDLIHRTVTERRSFVPCTAGRLTLVMTETGDLYPCESFEGKLGNLRESGYDIPSVLRSSEARSMVRDITERGCFCTHECYMMMNLLFTPAMYPRLLAEYRKLDPARASAAVRTHHPAATARAGS